MTTTTTTTALVTPDADEPVIVVPASTAPGFAIPPPPARLLTDAEVRETVRQMLAVWEAATPEQRAYALEQADQRVGKVANPRTRAFISLGGAVYAAEEGR